MRCSSQLMSFLDLAALNLMTWAQSTNFQIGTWIKRDPIREKKSHPVTSKNKSSSASLVDLVGCASAL